MKRNQTWPTEAGIFEAGDLARSLARLSCRAKPAGRRMAHCPTRDNVILYPTSFGAQHQDLEWLIGPEGILDPTRWFIVMVDMFGNGFSHRAPSNNSSYPERVSTGDNVDAQKVPLKKVFDVDGSPASTDGPWALNRPITGPVATPIRLSGSSSAAERPHCAAQPGFLDGLMALLRAAPEHVGGGRFDGVPTPTLHAFGRVYAGWAPSQRFYREGLHITRFGRATRKTIWPPTGSRASLAATHPTCMRT